MDRSTLRALALVSGLGFSIAIPLGFFFWGGLQLDEHWGTKPLFMLLGLFLGLLVAGVTMAKLLSYQRGDGGSALGPGTGRKNRESRRESDGAEDA